MDDHTCVFSARSILCEAHASLLGEGRDRSELALTMYACARAKMWRITHRLCPLMNLPFDQDDVGIYVGIVIFKTSYRRARRDVFDGANDSLVKLLCVTLREREIGEGEGLD